MTYLGWELIRRKPGRKRIHQADDELLGQPGDKDADCQNNEGRQDGGDVGKKIFLGLKYKDSKISCCFFGIHEGLLVVQYRLGQLGIWKESSEAEYNDEFNGSDGG